MPTIYKICDREEWETALAQGRFAGSAIDRQDGYIHFSDARQVRETARRHFAGRHGLVLLAVAAEALGADLRWEKSRGGDLFPHLHAPLAVRHVHAVVPLPWRGTAHDFPADIPA
ncbi:MAG: DUF952 domain-containing protein [Parvibaculaceae bacterium]